MHRGCPPSQPVDLAADRRRGVDQLPRYITGPAANPGGPFTSEQVLTLLEGGEAVALLPADPSSPIRHHGTWYAIPVGQPPDMWHPVQPQDAAPLDALLQRRLDLDPHQASGSP